MKLTEQRRGGILALVLFTAIGVGGAYYDIHYRPPTGENLMVLLIVLGMGCGMGLGFFLISFDSIRYSKGLGIILRWMPIMIAAAMGPSIAAIRHYKSTGDIHRLGCWLMDVFW